VAASLDASWKGQAVKDRRVDEADLIALLGRHGSMHSVPGAVGILREGLTTTAQYGVAHVRTGEPVTPETRFSVGSLTKSKVATVIARLAEAGLLALDDPVAAHVPELRANGWAQGATLRDLLANRSGIPLRSDLEFGFDVVPPGASDRDRHRRHLG
jgi:CubicO group peptidase (beta-lactamase class C family)